MCLQVSWELIGLGCYNRGYVLLSMPLPCPWNSRLVQAFFSLRDSEGPRLNKPNSTYMFRVFDHVMFANIPLTKAGPRVRGSGYPCPQLEGTTKLHDQGLGKE